jgi:hypothetical protein
MWPRPPDVTHDEYLTAWSALHGGYDPRRAGAPVRGWLLTAYRIGSWLGAHRVSPGTVTTSGLLLCLAVPAVAPLGRWGLLVGAFLVLLAAITDGLDGAVAVITGRVTRLGYVYDSVADRLGEAAWLLALWLGGAPGWLIVAAGGAAWLLEYLRARAASAPPAAGSVVPAAGSGLPAGGSGLPAGGSGLSAGGSGLSAGGSGLSAGGSGLPAGGEPSRAEIGTVTVAERPTRVSLAASGLFVAALAGFVHPGWSAPVLVVTAALWLAFTLIGFGQLVAAVRRVLAEPRR